MTTTSPAETETAAVPSEAHGMRRVAFWYVASNLAVVGLFFVMATTGHVDIGFDISIGSAVASPR